MEYCKIEKDFPCLENSVVTLGKFDGIHRGHRTLLHSILARKEQGKPAVVVAFDTGSKMILSHMERRTLLEQMGVDLLLECPLTQWIRRMSPEEFVKEILLDRLHASYVAVGEDYRFGYERAGTAAMLLEMGKRYGFETVILPKEMEGNRKVSSTYIREALAAGDMEKAGHLLGIPFFVEGFVTHGRGIGHKKLLPTVNVIPSEEKIMPPNGVYMTVSSFGEKKYAGITNIGYKPTVGGEPFLGVETFLFGCEEELYGKPCRTDFYHYSRPEKKFSSLDELRCQLRQDAENGKAYFGKNRVDK